MSEDFEEQIKAETQALKVKLDNTITDMVILLTPNQTPSS